MRFQLIFYIFLVFQLKLVGQSRSTSNWIDFGSSHVNKWLQVAPAKMGPNALPVPEMDYAEIEKSSKLELGVHSHFMKGDTAVNLYLNIHWIHLK